MATGIGRLYDFYSLVTCRISLVLIVGIAAIIESRAQEPVFTNPDFNNDLKSSHINDIYQASNGTLWFGTSLGLYSSDGISLDLLEGTATEEVTTIQSTQDGGLLVGFANGSVVLLKNRYFIKYIIKGDSLSYPVTGLVDDGQGKIWISTYGGGLIYVEDDAIHKVNLGARDEVLEIYSLLMDNQRRLWLGSDSGVSICIAVGHDLEVTHIGRDQGLPDNIVRTLTKDDEGNIWIGMQRRGVCKFNLKTMQIDQGSVPRDWDHGQVNAIAVVNDHLIWIGTEGDGLVEYNLERSVVAHQSLNNKGGSRKYVYDVLIDDEGNGWVADNLSGLTTACLSIGFMDRPGTALSENIQAIAVDSKNNIWFSTAKGLWEYQIKPGREGILKQHLESEKLGINIISLYVDINERIWIGTFGQGVLLYDPLLRGVLRFNEKSGIANDNVLSITGNKEYIWLATLGGVSKAILKNVNDGRGNDLFVNYHDEHGLGTDYIYQSFIDSRGRVWFATDGKGLTVLTGNEFSNFTGEDAFKGGIIYSVTEDSDGNIWFSTAREGIYRYDGIRFTNYGKAQGLSGEAITAMACTNTGELLVVHQKGLDVFNPRQETFRYYGSKHGVGDIDPDLNAVAKDDFGNTWIGTNRGIVKYSSPGAKYRTRPKILLNDILVYMEPAETEQFQSFKYNQNHLTFVYTALWFTNSEEINFQYRLHGVDPGWITSRDQFATYSNLSPGGYHFEVRASLDDLFRNAMIAEYNFSIGMPFWRTIWFYLAMGVLTMLIAIRIVKVREKRARKKQLIEREKYAFQFESLRSQINPHFLFNSFNTLISLIEEDTKAAAQFTDKLSDYFRSILVLRDRDLISLREELEFVQDYCYLLKSRYADNFNLNVTIPDHFLDSLIPPLTLQMLVENALKHNVVSASKPLKVKIEVVDHNILISNNIQLKKQPESSTQIGLDNILKQYRLIAGKEVRVEQDSHNFTVIVPIIDKPK